MGNSNWYRRNAVAKSVRTRFPMRLRKRNGTAAVEVAVMLPMFFLLLIGSIDIGRAVAVRHTLAEAARAGCRLYSIKNELTEADARGLVDQVMAGANLEGYSIQFDPSPRSSIDHLEPVTVSVSIPFDRVSWMSLAVLRGKTLTATCTFPGDAKED